MGFKEIDNKYFEMAIDFRFVIKNEYSHLNFRILRRLQLFYRFFRNI